ncbi:sodium channel subunit beta-3 isoform X1 [Solea senegalensis]|uniref:Sodium channel regulatory subunit beta-3 n=1 Tax=Solea senegalensis TaxID=28829 RepID=A0AAV6PD91_SOLSE|nr:sodium channel subunit beta-3 isoform X1 [Solea senegalensis]
MVTQSRVHLHSLALLLFVVHLSRPVCVNAPSESKAVVGRPMLLTCISCLRREEVKVKTRVDWFYMPNNDRDVPKTPIFLYENDTPVELDGPFKDRLTWNGSQDLQDVSIQIRNVTLNDSGVYECQVYREFEFKFFTPSVVVVKNITLKVKEKGVTNCFPLFPHSYPALLSFYL